MNHVIIHTDGSGVNAKDKHNSGHGGCGVVLQWKETRVQYLYGSFRNTTSARMEIFAIIKSLEICSTGFSIKIFTDNQYCQRTISHKWYENWLSHNTTKKNLDLWQRFKNIYDKHISNGSQIEITWIRGHAKGRYPQNEIADDLATKGRLKNSVIQDDRAGIYTSQVS